MFSRSALKLVLLSTTFRVGKDRIPQVLQPTSPLIAFPEALYRDKGFSTPLRRLPAMWISQDRLHRLKITGHLLQAILTFITGCMTLAILTEKREHDSRVQWCFALVRVDHITCILEPS